MVYGQKFREQIGPFFYFFGGGFVLGSPDTRRKTAGHLALAAKARVLVPNYRLAPELPFPAAIDDAVQAYQWLLDHGGELSKTIFAGDSAGGGLAVSTAIALRDRHLPMCAGIPPLLCVVGGDEILLDDAIRLVRNAGTAGIDATLFIAAGMQHIFAIWAGSFPEADAAIALVGDWVRARWSCMM